MFKDYPDILTVPQAAKALGTGVKAIYTLVKERKLGHIRIGRKIIIPKACLEDFVKKAKNTVSIK